MTSCVLEVSISTWECATCHHLPLPPLPADSAVLFCHYLPGSHSAAGTHAHQLPFCTCSAPAWVSAAFCFYCTCLGTGGSFYHHTTEFCFLRCFVGTYRSTYHSATTCRAWATVWVIQVGLGGNSGNFLPFYHSTILTTFIHSHLTTTVPWR